MLRKALDRFWTDQVGAIVSGEIALIATVAVTGVMAGMVTMRDAVNSELEDLAGAFTSLDQSYAYSGRVSRVGDTTLAWTSGSQWTDIVGVTGENPVVAAPESVVPDVPASPVSPKVEESPANSEGSTDPQRSQRRRRSESSRRAREEREQRGASSEGHDQNRSNTAQGDAVLKAATSWQTTTMPVPGHRRAVVREVRHVIPASGSDVVAVYPDCAPCRTCLPCGGCALPGCQQCVALVQVSQRSVDRTWPLTRDVCTGVHGVRVSDTLLSPRPCPHQMVDAAIYWGHLKPRDLKQHVLWSGHRVQNVAHHGIAEYQLHSPAPVLVPEHAVPHQHRHVVPQHAIPEQPVHEHLVPGHSLVPHNTYHPSPATTLVPLQSATAIAPASARTNAVPAATHEHAPAATVPGVPAVPGGPGGATGGAAVLQVPATAPAVQVIPGTTAVIREHASPAISVIPAARRRIPSVDHYYVAPPNQHQPRFPESVWNQ